MYMAGGINEIATSFDYRDNLYTKKLVDETGIDLRVTATPASDAVERLNILMNTGDYPDMILGTLDIEYYANQGVIIALDPYDPLSFPNIRQIFTDTPEAIARLTASDGKMYALPHINQCLHCTYAFGRTWFYMPWVRDTGRKTPETLDEFTEFLRFAKNGDPNGNGRRDEMGVVFSRDDTMNFITKIAKAYLPFVDSGLALDNNKRIVEQYRDPAFREALKYIAGLYQEGLIERDSFSMTAEQEMGIVRSAEPLAAVVSTSWIQGQALPGTQRFAEYFYLPALKGPTGQQWATNRDSYSDAWPAFYVTDKCKDPELAIALYDYINGPTAPGGSFAVGGQKGVYWDDADPGAVGYDGKPATWKLLMEFGTQPINSGWHNSVIAITSQAQRVSMQVSGVQEMERFLSTMDKSLEPQIVANTAYIEYMFYYTSMDASKHAMPESLFIPPQTLNNVDNTRVADIDVVLNPFKTQAFVEFITGVRDINNDGHWNAYLAELDRLGSPEMVSIRQKYIN
jgi:putative aldouronate transport system substrate-binding protein